jgi:hypothetical protein
VLSNLAAMGMAARFGRLPEQHGLERRDPRLLRSAPTPRLGEAAMWQHGHFWWNELMTRDVEGAKAFYGEMVGWRFEGMAMEGGTYWVCKDGEEPVGGIMDIGQPRFEGVPGQWFAYLAVDDRMRGSSRRRLRCPADATYLRCAGRRAHRDPEGPDRRWPGLDHAGVTVSGGPRRRGRGKLMTRDLKGRQGDLRSQ